MHLVYDHNLRCDIERCVFDKRHPLILCAKVNPRTMANDVVHRKVPDAFVLNVMPSNQLKRYVFFFFPFYIGYIVVQDN